MKYNYDIINGQKVPPLVVKDNTILFGTHQGSVYVENGVLTLTGTLQGSLNVNSGTKVVIIGKHQGSVNVLENGEVIVNGTLEGSTSVANRATVIVEKGGKLMGSLNNQGTTIVRGVYAGSCIGNRIILEDNGYIKNPIIKNGLNYYKL